MVVNYLDDNVVLARTNGQMLENLERVLSALRKGGLRINPTKTKLFQSEVTYLGHRVTANGIGMVPKYVDLLINWPVPTTKCALRAFLGKVQYYKKHLTDYSKIAAPLEKIKTGKHLVWTGDHLSAFEKLKAAFRAEKDSVRAYPVSYTHLTLPTKA